MLLTIAKYVNRVAPERMATSIVRSLAAMTQRPAVTAAQRDAIAAGKKLSYGDGNAAWEWSPPGGKGPLVIFVHGWAGRAAQLAPMAQQVAALGFRAVALDVTGHGESPKRHTRWEYFIRDVPALARSLGEDVYAYVGHSAGALSMMAARSLKGISAQRYACICAPSYPFPPVNVVQKKLRPKDAVMNNFKADIAKQFETTWDRLQTGCSFADLGTNLLLIYDETDRFVTHTEGDRIHGLAPGSRLIKTNQYSHQQSIEAPEIIQAVKDFLSREGPS